MSQSIISAKDIKIEQPGGRCSLAHKSLRQIPFTIIGKKASLITELDLSFNLLSDLPHLDWFPNLKSLVVDNNRIQSNSNFNNGKPLPKLELLWVNNCQIKHLAVFIDKVANCCPNLKMFSMLKNAACPNFFNGGTVEQYNDYRFYVLSRLRNLTVLDSTPVTQEEREEALKQYGDLKIEPKLIQMRRSSSRRIMNRTSGTSMTATDMSDLASSYQNDYNYNYNDAGTAADHDELTLPDVDEIERERLTGGYINTEVVSSVLPDVNHLSQPKLPHLPDPSQL